MSSTNSEPDENTILELRDLSKNFKQSSSFVTSLKETLLGHDIPLIRAVEDVNMTLKRGEVEGVIGESGCGKSTLLRTIMGLYSPSSGKIELSGHPTSEFTKKEWKEYRRRVQIILQDPFNTMDPKFTVRETLREPLNIHRMDNKEERVHDVLEKVELNPPEKYLDRTSGQLSGGEKQRVSIGRALILEPDVLLADEPVSMLDVSTQAAILQLLNDLSEELGVSMLYISHDLSTVSYVCDRVNVMYLGCIVESADTGALIRNPKHPYTQALIKAIPIPDPHYDRDRMLLEGEPSDPINLDFGCRFKDRCPERMDICDTAPKFVVPDDAEGSQDRGVACHLYYDHEETVNGELLGNQPDTASVERGEGDE